MHYARHLCQNKEHLRIYQNRKKVHGTGPHLVDASDDGSHRRVSGPIDGFSVVRRSPRGTVDVDQIRLVTHTIGLDEVGHVRLIQHANTGYLRVVRYAHSANVVVPRGCHLTRAPRSVAVSITNF